MGAGLCICSTIKVLIRLLVWPVCFAGHVVVAETARLLRHIAHALQCCVLVTNHVVGAGGSFTPGGREDSSAAASSSGSRTAPGGTNLSYKPALGEQWKGAAHVRLQLSRAGGDLVAASLLTHPMNVSVQNLLPAELLLHARNGCSINTGFGHVLLLG